VFVPILLAVMAKEIQGKSAMMATLLMEMGAIRLA